MMNTIVGDYHINLLFKRNCILDKPNKTKKVYIELS